MRVELELLLGAALVLLALQELAQVRLGLERTGAILMDRDEASPGGNEDQQSAGRDRRHDDRRSGRTQDHDQDHCDEQEATPTAGSTVF